MSIQQVLIGSLGQDQLRALELAALACGRLGATVHLARNAASGFLLLRHVVRVHDGTRDLAVSLLRLGAGGASTGLGAGPSEYGRELTARHPSLADALSAAGMEALLSDRLRDTLGEAERADRRHTSNVLCAAIAAGAIVADAPASREAQRGAALVGALLLASGGTLDEPWVAPCQLDAAARSAAVQVDRSGDWSEWIRAWCSLLEREAASAEQAMRNAEVRLESERQEARAQVRVGATDDAVLGWLHAHTTFTIKDASRALGLTPPTVGTAIARLDSMGFATELTGQQRDRIWVSTAFLDLAGER